MVKGYLLTNEELYQWYEYEKDIGDVIQCPICHTYISWDEYATNYGSCSDCFNESYEEYLNENKK